MLYKQKAEWGILKVNANSFPATFSALMYQFPPLAVERFSHVDQRIEVWNRGRSMSIVYQKYTAYDHFQGTGLYSKKKIKLTKYKQIRTLRFTSWLRCSVTSCCEVGFFPTFTWYQFAYKNLCPQLLSICIRFLPAIKFQTKHFSPY